MSSLDLSCKKRKRGERVFKFKTFCDQGYPVVLDGAFRQNVQTLLRFGHSESSGGGGLGNEVQSWSFQLEVPGHPPFHILLFVFEEPVDASLFRHCKHCQYLGWGQHFVCNKKYHFLVPSKETMASCEATQPADEGKLSILELQGHTMHGVFHSNGFGHLLCVNGFETGSNLSGHQIMDLWDRICTGLRARGVSVYDISRKRGMDLRLLHGVAYGVPWFGRWGYRFGRGSYNVSQQMYNAAIEALQNMPLNLLINHLGSFNHELPVIFSRYQNLADHALIKLFDLLRFMLDFKAQLPKETPTDSLRLKFMMDVSTSRWSPKRVEMAIRVIVEALKRAEFKWVSRQDVRDAARVYIGDTGLLDFVLKSLGNRIVGNFLVRRCLNPLTKVLEYCLEDVSSMFPNQDNLVMNKVNAKYKATRVQLTKDIFYLYKNILKEPKAVLDTGFFRAIPMASQIIFDTKYFIKDYSGEKLSLSEDSMVMHCTVLMKGNVSHQVSEFDDVYKRAPPYETFVVKKNMTVEELKAEVEKTFREIYLDLKSFVIESVAQSKEEKVLELVEKYGSEVVFEGSDKNEGKWSDGRKLSLNGYNERYIECQCGTRDDDGERMVSCDICEVWQHTRCARIPNSEEVPSIFLCGKCEHDITLLPSLP